jgi:hypothetical protein
MFNVNISQQTIKGSYAEHEVQSLLSAICSVVGLV